jgi:hypothetical protein
MKICSWCKKVKNIHTGEWENGPAEIIKDMNGSICPDCEKKIKKEYLKNRGEKIETLRSKI